MTAELRLYTDTGWESPFAFHAMVALEELRLKYTLEPLPLPIPIDKKALLARKALLGKIPCLVHGELWLTESSAISEYLGEQFPPPHALYPADPVERARARQVMSWLRTSLMNLREERPTRSVFQRPVNAPLGDKAKNDLHEVVRVTEALLKPGAQTLFATWSVADADLALMLMRGVANSDPLPQAVIDYAMAQWSRTSIRKYLAYIPTSH